MPHSSDLFEGVYTGRRERASTTRLAALIALVFTLIFSLFFGGEYLQRLATYHAARAAVPKSIPLTLDRPARDIIVNTLPELPVSWFHQKLIKSGLPVYDLRIRSRHLKQLQRTAEQVSAKSIATDIPRDYVPAKFRLDGQWVPINVKLRGLYYSHYHKVRPSLRLKFPRNHLFNGKRQINLLHPYDKDLTADITANWVLKEHDILTWDSQFVILRVNDEVVGLFQEIEQFSRSIWDRNGRAEGFIFSGFGQLFGNERRGSEKARAAIELVQGCGELEGSPLAEHCDWGFLDEYFDTDKWAWAGAVTLILNSQHSWAPDNLRMFWDPARGKFEPIPWDYKFYLFEAELHPEGERELHGYRKGFYGIPEYRQMRDQRAWTLLTKRVDAMIEHADALFEKLTPALPYDLHHPGLGYGTSRHTKYIDVLRSNKEFLMELFQKHDLRVLMWRDGSDNVTFALENHGKSFIAVNEIVTSEGERTHLQSLANPVTVDGLWFDEPGKKAFSVTVPQGIQVVGLTVQNKVTGATLTDKEISLARGEGPAPGVTPPRETPPLEIALHNVHVQESKVIFGPGRVVLDQTLEIPSSYKVVFAPNLELALGKGVSLIAYGDLSSVGSAASPIRISGAESQTDWGGIFVQGTRMRPSIVQMEHTIFRGGTGGENNRTLFTSPFSVHDGIVGMSSCQFLDSATDDGINLKYAEVDLRNNLFQGSKDDAVDCDFCTGNMIGNSIINAGGDGLDFSGSDLVVESNVVTRCGDKGISIGERTYAKLNKNIISDCYTGVAVKDSSNALIRGGSLRQLQAGIALYVKKPTFGPSRAKLESVKMEAVSTKFIREAGSTLEIGSPDSTSQ